MSQRFKYFKKEKYIEGGGGSKLIQSFVREGISSKKRKLERIKKKKDKFDNKNTVTLGVQTSAYELKGTIQSITRLLEVI